MAYALWAYHHLWLSRALWPHGLMASWLHGLWHMTHGVTPFVFQMSMPLLIALLLAIKALGSALLLRIKPSSSAMSVVRRGLGCLFEEPTDAAQLRHMTYEKFSTFIGMTNVLYDHNYIGHNYVGLHWNDKLFVRP